MARETTVPMVVDAETYGDVDSRVVMIAKPRSAAAEQYRVLSRKLERKVAAGVRRIAVTSATAGEGRTMTAINLALALGVGGRQRVALVDAHLRSPSVHTLLGLSTNGGLVDVVTGRATLEQSMWQFRSDDLWVLPAGRTAEPHEVIASRRLREVMAELKEKFDVVIVDAPPVLPTADMLALGTEVDGVLMVVQAGKTPREVIDLALETIAHVPLLGCVLNQVEAGVGVPYQLYARHDRELKALPAASAPALMGSAKG